MYGIFAQSAKQKNRAKKKRNYYNLPKSILWYVMQHTVFDDSLNKNWSNLLQLAKSQCFSLKK
jgi:hypothetical protein